jgi:RNA polymerase sigma-70 factor (ECF subfamily)
VVTLVDLEECSYTEAAEVLGIPIGTVMSRLCRARRALREALGPVAQDALGTRLRSVK